MASRQHVKVNRKPSSASWDVFLPQRVDQSSLFQGRAERRTVAELRRDLGPAACTTPESPHGDHSDASQVSLQGESTSTSGAGPEPLVEGLTCPTPPASPGWTPDSLLSSTVLLSSTTHNASVSPGRRPRHTSSSSSPLVYSILVEDKQVSGRFFILIYFFYCCCCYALATKR